MNKLHVELMKNNFNLGNKQTFGRKYKKEV